MSKLIALLPGVAGLVLVLIVAWLERSPALVGPQPPPPPRSLPLEKTPQVGHEVLLFRRLCQFCHGPDGAGNTVDSPAFRTINTCEKCHQDERIVKPARAVASRIPDFTDPAWHDQRTNERLIASILNGKGRHMPAFRTEITEDEARELVAYIRSLSSERN